MDKLHGVDLNKICDEFVQGRPKETFVRKIFNKYSDAARVDLMERQSKGLKVKDGIKSEFWVDVLKPHIEKSIREGIGKLLRPTSLALSESEIKIVMADVQSKLAIIGELRYSIDDGDSASERLTNLEKNLEKKNEIKNK